MTGKPFSPEEAEIVAARYLGGEKVNDIARIHKRSPSSIKDKLSRMGVKRGQTRREEVRLNRIKQLVSFMESGPKVLEQILEHMGISRSEFFRLRNDARTEVGAFIESDYVGTGVPTYQLMPGPRL